TRCGTGIAPASSPRPRRRRPTSDAGRPVTGAAAGGSPSRTCSPPRDRGAGRSYLLKMPSPSDRPRSQVAARTVWSVAFNLLAIAAVLLIVYRTRQVGWWILVTTCAALALDPVVSWLSRRGLPRWLAVLAVMLTGLVL